MVISKLNNIGTIFLLAVILYGSANKSWIRLSYEINKLEIIEKFCVNKDVKEYTCEGKCHLMAELEEADKSTPNADQILNEKNILLFNFDFKKIELKAPTSKSISYSMHINSYQYLFSNAIFDPPIA